MKKAIVYILFLFLSPELFSQSVYDKLNYNNFRQHPIFKETIDTGNFKPEILNACVFFVTNEIRGKKKLSIVSYHNKLEEAAMIHSNDMAEQDFFSHTNPNIKDRREPSDRALLVGIETPYIAENIIEGFILEYESGDEVVPIADKQFIHHKTRDTLQARTYLELADSMLDMWMDSEGHRKNILSKDAIQLGCGSALYFMRDFNNMPIVRATQCFQWFQSIPE